MLNHDPVRFIVVATCSDLLGESPEKASERVFRLRLVQGNLVFIGYSSQVRFERNKMVSVIIKEHRIGDLTSLYYKKSIRVFLSREQDEIRDFTGLFYKKGNSPALNSAH